MKLTFYLCPRCEFLVKSKPDIIKCNCCGWSGPEENTVLVYEYNFLNANLNEAKIMWLEKQLEKLK